MLYREIIAVCSQIHTKHTNTVCGQNVELLNVNLAVHIVTTWLWRVSRHRLTFSQATVNCPCPVPDTCLCTCVYLFFTPGTRTHSYTHSYLLQHACLSYKVPSFVCIASDNALAKQIAPHPTFTVFILVKRYKNKKMMMMMLVIIQCLFQPCGVNYSTYFIHSGLCTPSSSVDSPFLRLSVELTF